MFANFLSSDCFLPIYLQNDTTIVKRCATLDYLSYGIIFVLMCGIFFIRHHQEKVCSKYVRPITLVSLGIIIFTILAGRLYSANSWQAYQQQRNYFKAQGLTDLQIDQLFASSNGLSFTNVFNSAARFAPYIFSTNSQQQLKTTKAAKRIA